MSIFDKFTERVGDFFDEVMIPEPVRRAHDNATQLMHRGQHEQALTALRPSLVAHPNVARTHHLIGLCHFHLAQWGEAIAAFERALAIKEVAASHYYAGLAAEEVARWQDVQRHFARALGLGEDVSFLFELHHGLGRAYRALGRPDKAVKELRAALKVVPGDREATLTLAQTLVEQDRDAEAADALATLPDSRAARHLYLLGELAERRGDLDDAATLFADAAREDSAIRVVAAIAAARTSLALGRLEEAARSLDVEVAQGPRHAELYSLRGRIAELRGEADAARAAFEAALQIDARDATATLGLGRLDLAAGDTDAAAARFVRVFASGDPALRQEAWWGAGQCHRLAGDLAGARHLFEQALELGGPRSGEVAWSLGQTALELGDAAEAIVFLRDALETVPGARRPDVQQTLDEALGRLAPRWELPEALDNPERVLEVLNALTEYLGRDTRLSDFLPAAQRLHAAMNSPLSLAIVGEFNAGKSTIVNALVGEDVFPTGVLPTTAHTGILRWGPRKAARVFYRDGHRLEQSLGDARQTMKTDADAIDRLEFTHPHPDLRLVQYWDTPGFNALEERHETVAAAALATAEAILWVMDANQVLSQTEFDRIESLPLGHERLLVVINKIDRLGPSPRRGELVAELLEYVEDNLDGYIAGAFAISAQDATSADEAVATASGFDEFRAFLDEHVIHRAGRIKTLEVGRQLAHLTFTLHAFQSGLVQRYAALAADVARAEEGLVRLAATLPRERAAEEVQNVREWVPRLLDAIEVEIADALRPSGSWTGRRVLAAEDRKFVLELVLSRLQKVLDASRLRTRQILQQTERELAEQLDPVVRALALGDARALNRRLDGFFDETRVIAELWDQRVFGALVERARGRIESIGEETLTAIEAAQGDRAAWRSKLRELLPAIDEEFGQRVEGWYAAFFEAAVRLCSRVRKDLELLELEAHTRYDVGPLLALTPLGPLEDPPGEFPSA